MRIPVFGLGVLDQKTLEQARQKLKAWHADSARYYFGINLLTIATA